VDKATFVVMKDRRKVERTFGRVGCRFFTRTTVKKRLSSKRFSDGESPQKPRFDRRKLGGEAELKGLLRGGL